METIKPGGEHRWWHRGIASGSPHRAPACAIEGLLGVNAKALVREWIASRGRAVATESRSGAARARCAGCPPGWYASSAAPGRATSTTGRSRWRRAGASGSTAVGGGLAPTRQREPRPAARTPVTGPPAQLGSPARTGRGAGVGQRDPGSRGHRWSPHPRDVSMRWRGRCSREPVRCTTCQRRRSRRSVASVGCRRRWVAGYR